MLYVHVTSCTISTIQNIQQPIVMKFQKLANSLIKFQSILNFLFLQLTMTDKSEQSNFD